jgi:hypothetical protein
MRAWVLVLVALIVTDPCARVNAAVVSGQDVHSKLIKFVGSGTNTNLSADKDGLFVNPEIGGICTQPPDVNDGVVVTTLGNFPHKLLLKDVIICNDGFDNNGDIVQSVCNCPKDAVKCDTLRKACVPSLTKFNETPWKFLSVRGDPRLNSGIMSLGSLIFFIQVLGWLFNGMYLSLLVLDQYHPKASFVGSKALFWQYLYAGLIAAFGADDEKCGKRRKYFNFVVANVIGLVVSAMDMFARLKTENEMKLQGVPPVFQATDSDSLKAATEFRILGLPGISIVWLSLFSLLTLGSFYLVGQTKCE